VNDAVRALDLATLSKAARELADQDPTLARLYARQGDPPLWGREPGFGTLAWIVLGQQVSLASAAATYARLQAASGGAVSAGAVARIGVDGLRQIGFTRQKAGYVFDLASAATSGDLDLERVALGADAEVRAELVRHRGIGGWTADIYLLMALRRPDVWPASDLALAVAAQEATGWAERPSFETLAWHAERWRPWRSVGARMLWQSYLLARGRPLD
jgi:DNA-3-methyladenine glycosylase II